MPAYLVTKSDNTELIFLDVGDITVDPDDKSVNLLSSAGTLLATFAKGFWASIVLDETKAEESQP